MNRMHEKEKRNMPILQIYPHNQIRSQKLGASISVWFLLSDAWNGFSSRTGNTLLLV